MTTYYGNERPRDERSFPLIVGGWAVVVLAAASLIAWLWLSRADTLRRLGTPTATAPLPPELMASESTVSTVTNAASPSSQPAATTPNSISATAPPATVPSSLAPPVASALPLHTPLPPAPDPALIQTSPYGPLPVIGSDGRKPWQIYAKPIVVTNQQRLIAIVVTGMGRNAQLTDQAIKQLPDNVTLAFDPEVEGVERWVTEARANGHETLIEMPLEPMDYPDSDPGKSTLMANFAPADNVARLQWQMARGQGYVGMIAMAGSKFSRSVKYVLPVFEQFRDRGLLYVDNRAAPDSVAARVAADLGVPVAVETRALDTNDGAKTTMQTRLGETITAAKTDGQAVAVVEPHPVSFALLQEFIAGLTQQRIALVPVSAIARRQPIR